MIPTLISSCELAVSADTRLAGNKAPNDVAKIQAKIKMRCALSTHWLQGWRLRGEFQLHFVVVVS
jgi:hypothetical protein